MKTINIQPIEKVDQASGISLQVHSIFYTIQGEGMFTGFPAVFVRLAGCNLQCPSCDTTYTGHDVSILTNERIAEDVRERCGAANLVVITGGEPFRQNISRLCWLLTEAGFTVQIETNGTLPPPSNFPSTAFLVCSPKTGKMNAVTERRADAFKYVLSYDSIAEDGLPVLALNHSAYPSVARPKSIGNRRIYLQPMDAQDDTINTLNQAAVLKSCMKHGYILQLQLHKVIGVQ
jgi:organic radical activating enzyme